MTDQSGPQRDRYRVPRLEDLLNEMDSDLEAETVVEPRAADLNVDNRPTTDDFIGASRTFEEAQPVKRKGKPKRDYAYSPMYSRSRATVTERRWAMLAHASALLTLIVGLPSFGFLTLVTLFIPLGIYLYWRQKSEFVAFQALQAFTLQVLGTVGWLVLLVTGMIVGALLLAILAVTLVGFILWPIVIIAMVLFGVASLALPFAMIVFSMIAAFQTWQGVNYRLPRLSRWIDNQMYTGFLAEE